MTDKTAFSTIPQDDQLLDELNTVRATADCLYEKPQVEQAIQQMANALAQDYRDKNPVFLCVMNAAAFFSTQLLFHFDFPLQFDYLHATRYQGKTKGSSALEWRVAPQFDLKDRHVVILDDILDEGQTLKKIHQYCSARKPASLSVAVLLQKKHDRCVDGVKADYRGLVVPDRYVFGYGMDYKNYFRQLPAVYAVADRLLT